VVRPVHAGRPGHPTLFDRAVLERGLAGPLAEGARSIVAALGDAVLDLSVEDAGILADVDTPEDYRRLIGPTTGDDPRRPLEPDPPGRERPTPDRGAAWATRCWTPRPQRPRRTAAERPRPWSRGSPRRMARPRPGSWFGRRARSRARSGTVSWAGAASNSAGRRWTRRPFGPRAWRW